MTAIDLRGSVAPEVLERGRRGPVDPIRVQLAWWRSRSRRAGLRARPLTAPTPAGRQRLPGMRVQTELGWALDPYGRPFAVVGVPATGHVSGSLAVAVPAGVLSDPVRAQAWIGGLGEIDASQAGLPDDRAPVDCALVVQPFGLGATDRRPRMVLQFTWRGDDLSAGRDQAEVALEVGCRLTRLVPVLRSCRVGTARPLAPGELISFVRGAYRPQGGRLPVGRRPQWLDAAPGAVVEQWFSFRHGSAASTTWSMRPTSLDVVATLLAGLASVDPQIARPRVTLLRRPDVGAGSLSALVAVTSTPAALPDAVAAVTAALPASLQLRLRPRYGSHAAAFAAGLPTGTLVETHADTPVLLDDPPLDRGPGGGAVDGGGERSPSRPGLVERAGDGAADR